MAKKAFRTLISTVIAGAMVAMLAACTPQVEADQSATAKTIRIGYFANLTHAPALIAKQKAYFEEFLGDTKIEYTVFTAGPAAIEALKGGALDVAYIGPSPSIAGYLSTRGSLLKIVSGATSGGAKFIVQPDLIAAEGKPTDAEIAALAGKTIADPQLGGTQDVALRDYLIENGLSADGLNPDVSIAPLANADTLSQFQAGNIDGAWVPEPWATRLILEGGGKVFIDEADLWTDGQFVTTNVVASQKFLASYPNTVKAVLQANLKAIEFLNEATNQNEAKSLVQAELLEQTGKSLKSEVIDAAWLNLSFTVDPLAETLKKNFLAAVAVKQLKNVLESDLNGIYDVSLLNAVLEKPVSVPTELGKN